LPLCFRIERGLRCRPGKTGRAGSTCAPGPGTFGGGGKPGLVPGLITPPADYVIGAGDVLAITYWRDKDGMSGDYGVRPDGKITLPLLNDIDVQGLTPEQLRQKLTKVSVAILEDPTITVGLRAINSRKVYIGGGILKPVPTISCPDGRVFVDLHGRWAEGVGQRQKYSDRARRGRQDDHVQVQLPGLHEG
jgi:hypothetical protein